MAEGLSRSVMAMSARFFFAAEVDGVFEMEAVERVAEVVVKDVEVELADGFLRGEFDVLFAGETVDVRGGFSTDFLEEDGFFEGLDLRLRELGELVVRILEEVSERELNGRHGNIFLPLI